MWCIAVYCHNNPYGAVLLLACPPGCVAVCYSELPCDSACCVLLSIVITVPVKCCCRLLVALDVLQCVTVSCNVFQRDVGCWSVLQCVGSVLQCVAVGCSMLQCVTVSCNHVAVCYCELHCDSACGKVLQCNFVIVLAKRC